MAAIVEDGKLRLSGYVGDAFFEDGFTSGDVVVALADIDDDADLTVHINSGGGIATEGAAIHALLSARPGKTDIVVEGIAASAASLIAMAGDTVTMSLGSVMMIHDPSGFTFGTSADHEKTVEGLEALATAYARVYAAKSGKSAEDCRAIMREERWFTPEQAVAEGFADATTAAKAEPVAAFDYRLYAHAPKRLAALAKAKNWRLPDADPAAPAAPRQTEKTMTDKERADALAAEVADLKAKLEASTTPEPGLSEQAAAEIADICMAANAPGLIATLIREKATKEQATARANAVGQIRQMVADAGKVTKSIEASMADDMIKRGLSVEKAREEVFAKLVANQSPEIDTQNPNVAAKPEAVQAAAAMVANMKKLIGKEAV